MDFLWGRSANTIRHNEGGGFNADQVNIQTKNVNVAIYPTRDPRPAHAAHGHAARLRHLLRPDAHAAIDIVRTGYKLSFLGSDATGLSVFSSYKGHAS